MGRDGIAWYTDQANSYIGRLDPATGKVTDYATPTPASGPHGIVPAPDGSLWMALFGTNALGHIDVGTGEMHAVPLPDGGARPRRLAVGGDGRVWYPDYARGNFGVHDPRGGTTREFASPGGARSSPYGIAAGSDGRVWYDEAGTSTIVAFDPRTEKMERLAIPTKGAIVRHMVVDSTRASLWLAPGRLGRVTLGAARQGRPLTAPPHPGRAGRGRPPRRWAVRRAAPGRHSRRAAPRRG